MASKKPVKKAAKSDFLDDEGSSSEPEDEQILFGGERSVAGYDQPAKQEGKQQSAAFAGHNFVHLHF